MAGLILKAPSVIKPFVNPGKKLLFEKVLKKPKNLRQILNKNPPRQPPKVPEPGPRTGDMVLSPRHRPPQGPRPGDAVLSPRHKTGFKPIQEPPRPNNIGETALKLAREAPRFGNRIPAIFDPFGTNPLAEMAAKKVVELLRPTPEPEPPPADPRNWESEWPPVPPGVPSLPPGDPNTTYTITFNLTYSHISTRFTGGESAASYVEEIINSTSTWTTTQRVTITSRGLPQLITRSILTPVSEILYGLDAFSVVTQAFHVSIYYRKPTGEEQFLFGLYSFSNAAVVDENPGVWWGSTGGHTTAVSIEITPEIPLGDPPPELILVTPPSKQPKEEEEVCDLSGVRAMLNQILMQNANLQAQASGAQLAINANIDTLKPPISTINATTTTINSKVDNLGQYLTNVNTNVTGARTQVDNLDNLTRNISTKVDDMGGKINNIGTKLDDVGDVLNQVKGKADDIFEAIGNGFREVGDRFDKLARWLRLPQLLSALTLIVTLHNAAMLSSNLIQSLGEIIDIGLNIIGLKDENDQEFNISEILGKQANELAASILGQGNWNSTKETWKKVSNVYRAAANALYSLQSICESMINILQVNAEATGKIGNALKRAGVVAENAYNWLPEQINLAIAQQTAFRGVLNNLRSLSDTADSLQTTVSETRNIQTEYSEFLEKKQKFDQEINKVVTSKNTAESTAKQASQTPPITPEDLTKP